MLYLVLTKNNRIIGRFKRKEKALEYLIDCWFDGMDNVKIKTVTEEQYLEMANKGKTKNK